MSAELSAEQEAQFQTWIQALPWFAEFKKQYGETPNLDDPDYDYRAAWLAGIKPERYEHDGGAYHWPSVAPGGVSLKSANHPTAWMESFMQQYGIDPHEAGGLFGLLNAQKSAPENSLLGMPVANQKPMGLLF